MHSTTAFSALEAKNHLDWSFIFNQISIITLLLCLILAWHIKWHPKWTHNVFRSLLIDTITCIYQSQSVGLWAVTFSTLFNHFQARVALNIYVSFGCIVKCFMVEVQIMTNDWIEWINLIHSIILAVPAYFSTYFLFTCTPVCYWDWDAIFS